MTVKRMDNVGIVVEDIDAATRLSKLGAKVVDEVVNYENVYRLCYIRGPEGILIGLAQQLGQQTSRENPLEGIHGSGVSGHGDQYAPGH